MTLSNRQFLLISILAGLLFGIAVYYLTKPKTSSALSAYNAQSFFSRATNSALTSFHGAVIDALPAVVSVYTEQSHSVSPRTSDPLFNSLFGENGQLPLNQISTNQGSGVIFNSNGYIVTNEHLIRNADNIRVVLSDGQQFEAEFVGADDVTDIAVLKISSDSALPQIRVADEQPPRVGDVVLAIGNPYGFGQTVTMGIISATGRGNVAGTLLQDFIQIDAAINPGNSGGPLVNPNGELIGINTAVYAPDSGAQGISFALPVRLVNYVVPQLIENMAVSRGWLGLQVDDLHYYPQLRAQHGKGIVVTGVYQGSPAAEAGLQSGDVITHFSRLPVYSARQMILETTTTKPGTEIIVSGRRQQEKFSISIKLAARPE